MTEDDTMTMQLEGMQLLSKLVQQSAKPSVYAREFLHAVETGKIVGAIMLADRIPLKPATNTAKTRYVNEFAIIDTPELQEWHTHQLQAETAKPAQGLPTLADIMSGNIDIKAMQAKTNEMLKKRRARVEQAAKSRIKK